jgi:hypothetical protein
MAAITAVKGPYDSVGTASLYPKRYPVCIVSETVISKCPSRAKEGLSTETEVRGGN